MILIGSPARGDRAAGSDADPVVPVDRHDRPGPFRGPESLPAEPVGMPLAPLGCTPEERRAGAPRSRAEAAAGVPPYRRCDVPAPDAGPPPAAHGPGRAAPGAGAFRPGEGGRLNSLEVLLLLLLAGAVYAAAAFGPAFIRNYQLANAFDDEARRAHLLGDDEIRANVLRKARAIGFEDWDADDIVVERDADQRRIRVSADYTVEVELLGGRYVWPLRFHPVVDRPIERR